MKKKWITIQLLISFLILTVFDLNSQICTPNKLKYSPDNTHRILSENQLNLNNDTIEVKIFLEVDYKAYLRLGSSVLNVESFTNQLIEEANKIFNKNKVNIIINRLVINTEEDEYFDFDKNDENAFALERALEVFYSKYNSDTSSDLYYYIGGEPVYAGGVATINVFSNLQAIGFGGQNFGADANNLFNQLDVYVFCHEVGHIFGLPHTHYCDWGEDYESSYDDCGNAINTSDLIDQNGDCAIDDLEETEGPETCFDITNPIIPENGGTIMSYCHIIDTVGINYDIGFGDEPGNRMYSILTALRTNIPIPVHEEDLMALKEIYSSLNGNNWLNKNGWESESSNLRDWHGIEIDPKSLRVAKILLKGNNLSGIIPNLNPIRYLQEIDLRDNSISGLVTNQFSELMNLRLLILSNNTITGRIDKLEINSKKIEGIFLASNKLEGELPEFTDNWNKLYWLSLSNNNLTGNIPKSISKLTNLSDIGFQYNQLTGILPRELGDLKLVALGLAHNNFTGCFSINLKNLCSSLSVAWIEEGNQFDITWLDFCENADNYCAIIDLDNDGFNENIDCDDNNASINPNAAEIPYNGIDDDCNPLTPDNDIDGDCFLLFNDCDDNNPNVNLLAEEIPNNGIDDDCNNGDLITTSNNLIRKEENLIFYPNPVTNTFFVKSNSKSLKNSHVNIYSIGGAKIFNHTFRGDVIISTENMNKGYYIIEVRTLNTVFINSFVKQ